MNSEEGTRRYLLSDRLDRRGPSRAPTRLALAAADRAGEIQAVLAAHTLAEAYSVLTRMPHTPPISSEVAWQAIERNLAHFEVVALTAEEYAQVMSNLAASDIRGGPTYDALIAAVARKAAVDLLLTLNPNHFRRVAPDLADRIQEP